jgi:hypothetical protein
VNGVIAKLAVGLAADCDKPEDGIDAIMRERLKGASTLPFVGFLTHDGEWIDGFSGYKDAAAFAKVLEAVDKSPLLQATPAVQKKLAALATTAGKAAEREDWKGVMKVVRDAGKLSGRCAERDAIGALEKKARDWAVAQFDAAIKIAQTGGELDEAKKALASVRKHFTGEPEAEDAGDGLKALGKLKTVLSVEARGSGADGVRERAAEPFKDTRWARMFEQGTGATDEGAEPAPEPETPDDEPE